MTKDNFSGIRKYFSGHKKPSIQEIVREPGETAQVTAKREIGEETGLKKIEVCGWLGKVNFRYRRIDKLVLMTTQVYLVKALDPNEKLQKEAWMNGLKWFSFHEALDEIEYEDIGKLILLAMKRIRQENL